MFKTGLQRYFKNSRFQNLRISKKTAGTFPYCQFFFASSFKGKGYKVKGERGWRRKNLKIYRFRLTQE
jgi:hypothetical protein